MKILSLVANRLLCATGKKQLYETVKAEFSCGGYSFHVSGKTVLQNGWKEFEAALKRTYRVEKQMRIRKRRNCRSFLKA